MPEAGFNGRRRVVIEGVSPAVDGGSFPAKRVVGDTVVVEADIFADGFSGPHAQAAVSDAFLRAYLDESGNAPHLPRSREEFDVLLNAHLLEKALYEIVYELNNRPDWVRIPLRGVLELL